MDNQLTIVVDLGDKELSISLEDGKVMSGTMHSKDENDLQLELLEVVDNYELCGYPYTTMKRRIAKGVKT